MAPPPPPTRRLLVAPANPLFFRRETDDRETGRPRNRRQSSPSRKESRWSAIATLSCRYLQSTQVRPPSRHPPRRYILHILPVPQAQVPSRPHFRSHGSPPLRHGTECLQHGTTSDPATYAATGDHHLFLLAVNSVIADAIKNGYLSLVELRRYDVPGAFLQCKLTLQN